MKYLSLFLALALVACSPKPDDTIDWKTIKSDKACLINAVGFNDAYRAHKGLKDRWSEVLYIKWQQGDRIGAHAVCVYWFDSKLWIYDPDRGGSLPYGSNQRLQGMPTTIAKMWAKDATVLEAWYMEEEGTVKPSPNS